MLGYCGCCSYARPAGLLALDPGVTWADVPLPLPPVGGHLLYLYCGRGQSEVEVLVPKQEHTEQEEVVRGVLGGLPHLGLRPFPPRRYLGTLQAVEIPPQYMPETTRYGS